MNRSERPVRRLLAYLVLFFLGFVLPVLVGIAAFERRKVPQPLGLWRHDSECGYAHVPGASGSRDGIQYTIDSAGNRVTPTPAGAPGHVVILGCSWSFGQGVQDGEAYPAVLGARYWPGLKVESAAVNGWGPANALQRLRQRLQGEPRPDLVIYSAIPHHLSRSLASRVWLFMQNSPLAAAGAPASELRGHPRFDLEGGKAIFFGVVGEKDALDVEPSGAQANELFAVLVVEMAAACESAGIPFVVALLPTPGVEARWPASVIRTLAADARITIVDITDVAVEGLPRDRHPTAQDHQQIARALAEAPELKARLAAIKR